MAYTTATLTGTYQTFDNQPASGVVEIIPNSRSLIDAEGNKILAGRVKVTLDGTGSFTVTLPATDDPTVEPATGRQYTVVAKLRHAHLPAVTGVELATGATVDVADVSSRPATDALVSPAATLAQHQALEADVAAHVARTDNPHATTAAQVGADPAGSAAAAQAAAAADATAKADAAQAASTPIAHTTDVTNPHGVTKAQVGLGNVDNVSASSLRDRSTHTGTQPAASITGLAPVATSGVYTDLTGQPTIPTTPSEVGAEPAGLSAATQDALSASYVAARVVDGLGTGADQKAAIDTALTEAAAAGGPAKVLIRGAITTSGGHVVPEGVTVEGLGPEATKVTHTGNNACFSMLGNDSFWKSPHLRSMTIVGNAGASAKGIHLGNNYMTHIADVHVQDYTAGVGIHLENTVLYTEGVQLDRVHIRTCARGLKFSRSGTGTDSFSECRFYGLSIGMSNTNTIGIEFGPGVLLYGGVLDAKVMIGPTGTGSVGIQLDPTAVVHNTRVSIYQEGATGAGLVIPAGGRWEVYGNYYSESNHSLSGMPVPGVSEVTRQAHGALPAAPRLFGTNTAALAPANRCVYQRIDPSAAGQVITKVGIYVGTSAGNISVGVYTSPDGRNNPDNRVATSGAVACPAAGYAEVTLDGPVLLTDNHWIALSADSTTATFGCAASSGGFTWSEIGRGISAFQDTAHPVPSPPAANAAVGPGFWLIGVP